MNNVLFMSLSVCKSKRGCPCNTYGEINEEYFAVVKLSCCTPPQVFESYFLRMENSTRPDVFFFSIQSNSVNEH